MNRSGAGVRNSVQVDAAIPLEGERRAPSPPDSERCPPDSERCPAGFRAVAPRRIPSGGPDSERWPAAASERCPALFENARARLYEVQREIPVIPAPPIPFREFTTATIARGHLGPSPRLLVQDPELPLRGAYRVRSCVGPDDASLACSDFSTPVYPE